MKQLVETLGDTFNQFWQARQERERSVLSLLAAVVVLTIIYLIFIDPALSGREQLRKALPGLHQQVAQMQQMAQELTAIPGPENRHELNRELVENSLTSNGLKAQVLTVNDGIVRAQFTSTSMSALQTWLLDMQKSGGLFVEEIKITGLEAGQISANLTLRQSGQTGNGA